MAKKGGGKLRVDDVMDQERMGFREKRPHPPWEGQKAIGEIPSWTAVGEMASPEMRRV